MHEQVIRLALDSGATAAECTVSEGEQFSVNVRMGEVETLTEAGSRGIGVRVLVGKHTGSAYTSDLTRRTEFGRWSRSAMDLAKITTEDPFAGLPSLGNSANRCAISAVFGPSRICRPTGRSSRRRMPRPRAFAVDSRIYQLGRRSLRHAHGPDCVCEFARLPRELSERQLFDQRDSGSAAKAHRWSAITGIPSLATRSGSIAPKKSGGAQRNGLCVGWERAKCRRKEFRSCFDPRVARSLVDNIFDAVSGDSIYRGESFLAGKWDRRSRTKR